MNKVSILLKTKGNENEKWRCKENIASIQFFYYNSENDTTPFTLFYKFHHFHTACEYLDAMEICFCYFIY